MSRFLLAVIILMGLFMDSKAQSMDEYTDKLFHGLLSLNPDNEIHDFVKKYIPAMLRKQDTGAGKWTSYPPIEEPSFRTEINTYVFYSHPLIGFHFKAGQLAITQKIYNNPKWLNNFTDVKLWFEFDNKADAIKAYQVLVNKYKGFKSFYKITVDQNASRAAFANKKSDNYYSNIQIVMGKDLFSGKQYAQPTKTGVKTVYTSRYKMLITIGNDLF